ncbi:MAG: 50S ribosome-binding GTPase, partial [Nanoarchaeota archaeon]|nr:50S ribosome-binding GTPase [Nanoarchaeota archaeon]
MASTNQSPQYQKAAAMFLMAGTDKERLHCLEEMIRECPKHKSSEKMLANLKTRYKKLKERSERIKKSGKSGAGKHAIRKEDMQAVIVGLTNTGKSSLLSLLTNVSPEITPYDFTTKT